MSQEARPKGRRGVLAVAAALAVVVGGGYAAVHPAVADSCDPEIEFFCPEDGAALDLMPAQEDELQPETTEVEEELAPEMTDEAEGDWEASADAAYDAALKKFKEGYDGAHARLAKSDKKCMNLISGSLKPGEPDARKVLDLVFTKQNITMEYLRSPKHPVSGKAVYAISEGAGADGKITLYKPYFDSASPPENYQNPPGAPELDGPDGRVLIMLHELAHLMGTVVGDEDNPYAVKTFVFPFNAQIVKDCVRNR
ncbi:hypothetical protein ACIBQ1_43900 [Nonomuraea sp. NPDC050153]|uniref:hypothetical protein n=1 Tax=Nonomuraea sp. NPDC050153 TaxID=3364359 RepID=UPI0037B337F0